MNFVAIDVETANADIASICQIGLVTFSDGIIKDSWQSLVNPQDYFDGFNISIHGINQEMVSASPSFPDLHQQLSNYLEGNIVVCHTYFVSIFIWTSAITSA